MHKLVVKKVDDQGDRIVLYGDDPQYHLIADTKAVVKVGDQVEYETGGVNFGWFVRVLTSVEKG